MSRRRVVGGTVLAALLAPVLALVVFAPFDDWAFTPRLLPYIIPNLLRPGEGYLTLVLLLFLVIWVPLVQPAAWGAEGRRSRRPFPGPDAPIGTADRAPRLPAAPADPRARVEIPRAPLTALDARQRHQIAMALDITWDGRLARDDRLWERTVRRALRRTSRGA
ncbi:hypothetical protein [Brachybacterium hainanense]|uniref:Uncharacterized protein n=1 Tax=Brachybacterium hainanense TaxID=1541174 RepID=A0ABV6RE53_9MICO